METCFFFHFQFWSELFGFFPILVAVETQLDTKLEVFFDFDRSFSRHLLSCVVSFTASAVQNSGSLSASLLRVGSTRWYEWVETTAYFLIAGCEEE